jgi:hypothetical protein
VLEILEHPTPPACTSTAAGSTLNWISVMVTLTYFMEICMPHPFRLMVLVMIALTVFIGMGTLITHLSGDTGSSLLAITTLVCMGLTVLVRHQVEEYGLYKAIVYSNQLFAKHNARLQRDLLKAR